MPDFPPSSALNASTPAPSRVGAEALQPFGGDICSHWNQVSPSAAAIYEEALRRLQSLSSQERLVRLASPRAGFGKTSLLGLWANQSADSTLFASLPWSTAEGLTLQQTLHGLLAHWHGPALKQICTGVLVTLLRRLIQKGQVPCANRTQALAELKKEPQQLLAADGHAKPLADWFAAQFNTLLKPLAGCADLSDAALSETWLRRIWQAAGASDDEALSLLQRGLQSDRAALHLLDLICQWKPLVMIADHLDALGGNAEASRELASLALTLSQRPGLRVILSVNQDWWENTLTQHLPSALLDRLDASTLHLTGLELDGGFALLRHRLQEVSPAASAAFLRTLDLEPLFAERESTGVSPRELLRWAARHWNVWQQNHPLAAMAAGETAGTAPLPTLPMEAAVEDAAAMQRLARHLEEESRGQVVDLSRFDSGLDAVPPGVVPLPEPAWKGSFLVEDDELPAAPVKKIPAPAKSASLLQDRFEQWRAHISRQTSTPELDEAALRELLRLAGQQFPMIHFDEVELPGLSGQSIPRWTLQGQEIVFGIAPFDQSEHWRLLASYVAGRLAEFATASTQFGEPMPDLKWVVIVQDQTATTWQALRSGETLPPSLRGIVDAVLLAPAEQLDLAALHALVRETSHLAPGRADTALHALLAERLAGFWRRITRPMNPQLH